MSFDVKVGSFEENYTYNSLGPMCRDHLHKDGLWYLHGLTGKQAHRQISQFWESLFSEKQSLWMEKSIGEPALQAKYDSPNGWGSCVGAMLFMARLTSACAEHPRHKVLVS